MLLWLIVSSTLLLSLRLILSLGRLNPFRTAKATTNGSYRLCLKLKLTSRINLGRRGARITVLSETIHNPSRTAKVVTNGVIEVYQQDRTPPHSLERAKHASLLIALCFTDPFEINSLRHSLKPSPVRSVSNKSLTSLKILLGPHWTNIHLFQPLLLVW